MSEEWRDIPSYENLYQVSDLGNIRRGNRILKPSFNTAGYLKVGLSKNGKVKTYMIHQLMAITFIGNYVFDRKIIVDHKDNVKTNNVLDNLQLITFRKNVSKDRIGSSKYTGVSWNKTRKKWYAYINTTGKNKFLGSFDNENDAALAYSNALNEYKERI